jgi:ribosome recycling factor
MAYAMSELQQKIEDTVEHFKGELGGIRTGRAAPGLLDGITVDAYGTPMPLVQVGNIGIEDARTLRVAPWDLSLLKNVEGAIEAANLGVSVGSDEKGVRVFFPELTSERREQLVKLTRTKLEDARVTLRQQRDHTWSDIQQKQKDGELTEDEKFTAKDTMEKTVQDGNKTLEELAKKKEEELRA